MANHPSHPFGTETSQLIRTKAWRLCRHRGFTASDRDDIEQELALHLWRQSPRYDPAIGAWLTWASFVLDKRCVSIVRHRTAARRSPAREECSLDELVRDGDGRLVARHEIIVEAPSVPLRLRALRQDAESALDLLGDVERHLAIGLGTGTVNAVTNELGLSRRAAARSLDAIREVFEDAGLRDHL